MLPSWQKSGLGKGLVERLVNDLLQEGIPVVSLFAEPKVVALYERLGFAKVSPPHITSVSQPLVLLTLAV